MLYLGAVEINTYTMRLHEVYTQQEQLDEGPVGKALATAEDIAFPYLSTMRQQDEWMKLEELVLKNIAQYGTTSPQTIGLIRNELAKLGSNIKINAITPNNDGTGLLYSTPDRLDPFRPGRFTDKERKDGFNKMFPPNGRVGRYDLDSK